MARAFVAWLGVPPGARWLDVGCGTGALAAGILEVAAPRESEGFVAHAGTQVTDPRARFDVGDALALPSAAGAFDAAVSGLVLNVVPDPARAAAEMARVTRPGGAVVAYVWDYAGRMQLMRHFWDVAGELDPAARELDEGRRFPLRQPRPRAELFRNAGLDAVEVRPIDGPTRGRDFDDYWSPFLGGQGPAPGYAMSLGEERRAALRERGGGHAGRRPRKAWLWRKSG